MKATVYSTDGKKGSQVELPAVFSTEHRPDVIRRAFLSRQSRGFQAKGTNVRAGFRTTAENWHTGAGRSRIPRVKAGPHRGGRTTKGHRYRSKGRWFAAAGSVRIVPQAVGGRQAHPPKSIENIYEKVNKKELKLALASAIAATANKELVQEHGHQVEELTSIPIIIDNNFMTLTKTKEALTSLRALGLGDELERIGSWKVRAGKGKMRGRKYKKKVGPLFVITEEKGIEKAARNITGVEVVTADRLSIEHLAPGSIAGRLTLWTQDALKIVQERFEEKKKEKPVEKTEEKPEVKTSKPAAKKTKKLASTNK